MKAAIIPQYGTPDVICIGSIDRPTPKANDVLIKVHAATVGPADIAYLTATPFIIRLIYGLRRPRYAVGGTEFSGEVVAVGPEVTTFRPGDAVFGMSPNQFGAHAEYLCLPEDAPLVLNPAHLSFQEMVAICDGAPTAMTFLKDVANVRPGQKVLVNGASGAVGTAGVQIAKYLGAEVTGVCSTRNVDLVRSLGADHVIDYTREDFTRSGETYDVIFDAVGKRSFTECKRALKPKGLYLTTVISLRNLAQVARTSLTGGKRAKFVTAGLMQNKSSLSFIKAVAEAGHLRAVIDRCYPLEQIADAYRYVETGRKRGNVIVDPAGAGNAA
jgi:NADPH:quinone reductase-like Zn-dependent oxidoreductase